MRQFLIQFFVWINLFFFSGVTYASNNPLPVKLGDPYVLLASDGKYYMYGTGGDAVDGFCTYSSTDLVNWKAEGQVFRGNIPGSWGIANFWAPEVYERNGKFYMLYSADWNVNPTNEQENFRIGVAVADKPTGPFKELSSKPLFDPGYPVIDGNLVVDKNGRTYLYFSRCCYKHPVESEIAEQAKKEGKFDKIEESWIYGIEVKPDLTGVIGKPVLLLRPPVKLNDKQSEWESRSVTSGEVNRRWTEGPFAFRKGDTYYMMYSANYFGGKNYAVGYATANSPLGPFVKASNNPVLQKNVEKGGIVTGTGHNSVTWSKDGKQMYCVYHGRTQETGDERVVFIDKMGVDKNGRLYVEGPTTAPKVTRLSDIPIRDPFILTDAASKTYYMYRSSSVQNKIGNRVGDVEVFKSKDLKNWEGPVRVFTVPDNNWITGQVWAPEVHAYKGKYYLFATLNSDIQWKKSQKGWPDYTFRGTQIFYANTPEGPFLPFNSVPHTSMDRMALDGTLWVEKDTPYMVYCHEWVQVADGKMELMPLAKDLSAPAGDPVTLFCASAADWSTGTIHESPLPTSYVTDGCFLYRTKTGKLLMIWSSFMNDEYAVGIAESATGKVNGPWKQQKTPLFSKNGGHGMIFKSFDGKLYVTFHGPNSPSGSERAHIYELEDTGDTLVLKNELH